MNRMFHFCWFGKSRWLFFGHKAFLIPFVDCWHHQSFYWLSHKVCEMIIELGKFSEKLPDSGRKHSDKMPETSNSVDENLPFSNTLRKELWSPLLLQSHRTFVYLQRNTVNNNKVSSLADMPSCVPFVFAKGIIGEYCPLGKTKWLSQHDLLM